MNEAISIYQIQLGLGEYVFCATSYMDLYKRIFHGNERLKWELLRNKENTGFISYNKFIEEWKDKGFITRTSFHLGYLGGYSE